jgi:hypothetical protein
MSTGMHAHVGENQLEREALFATLVDAFITRDFAVFDEAVREDVLASLPGTSRLAGTHNGREAFGRFVVAMRKILWSNDMAPTYTHEDDLMTVRHGLLVMGPRHQVEMIIEIQLRFDADGKVASCRVQPEDLGLFDHVARSTLPYLADLP